MSIGAIVGEHTYNVDAYDRLQSYYVKAASYAGESFRFAYNGEDVDDFIKRPQFAECNGKGDSYALWSCREDIWESDFRGKTVDGKSFPNNRFSAVFFQPFYAGQTFGLGQINPLTALMLSDLVTKVSGYEKLNEKDAGSASTRRSCSPISRSLSSPPRSAGRLTITSRSPAWIFRRIQA